MDSKFLNDWRLNGQEEIVMNAELKKETFNHNGHEHCIFCWHKFMKHSEYQKNCSNHGYCTIDEKYWICDNCYNDFKNLFKWKLVKQNK